MPKISLSFQKPFIVVILLAVMLFGAMGCTSIEPSFEGRETSMVDTLVRSLTIDETKTLLLDEDKDATLVLPHKEETISLTTNKLTTSFGVDGDAKEMEFLAIVNYINAMLTSNEEAPSLFFDRRTLNFLKGNFPLEGPAFEVPCTINSNLELFYEFKAVSEDILSISVSTLPVAGEETRKIEILINRATQTGEISIPELESNITLGQSKYELLIDLLSGNDVQEALDSFMSADKFFDVIFGIVGFVIGFVTSGWNVSAGLELAMQCWKWGSAIDGVIDAISGDDEESEEGDSSMENPSISYAGPIDQKDDILIEDLKRNADLTTTWTTNTSYCKFMVRGELSEKVEAVDNVCSFTCNVGTSSIFELTGYAYGANNTKASDKVYAYVK